MMTSIFEEMYLVRHSGRIRRRVPFEHTSKNFYLEKYSYLDLGV